MEELEKTSMASGTRDMGIPPSGGGYAGGRFGVDEDMYLQVPE